MALTRQPSFKGPREKLNQREPGCGIMGDTKVAFMYAASVVCTGNKLQFKLKFYPFLNPIFAAFLLLLHFFSWLRRRGGKCAHIFVKQL